jgi:long-chain acyl-CoA synthetase
MALLTRDFATDRANELALADDAAEMTWAELDVAVNRAMNALTEMGIGPGDTIAIVAGNCNEWFILSLACGQAGVTFVPVNWHLVAPELAYIFGDSDAKAVFAGFQFTDVVHAALANEQSSRVEHSIAFADPSTGAADERFTDFSTMLANASDAEAEKQIMGGPMFYTSGTTGNPKGVRGSLTSLGDDVGAELWQLVGAGFAALMPVPGVTVLCGPVYHSAQWAFAWLPMIAGSAVVMQHKYDSAGVLDLIDRHGGTNIHLVPTQMKRLVDLPDDVKAKYDGSTLSTVLHGAAPCPPAVKRQLIDWWGPKITEYYGSTEGSVVSMIDSEAWLERGGSVGQAMDNIEIMIIGEDGAPCGPNESGTIYFRNKMGMDFEYHKAPEKTAEVHLEPGVATSGDVGYLDDDGYLWLSDRKIDMIISGGVNIYPAEIEGVIGGHADVADVSVLGVPNEEYGEEVKAIVVANDGVDQDALAETLRVFCRENLAGYKVPRSIDFLDELPRTGTGKVQKRKLREKYWADHERSI